MMEGTIDEKTLLLQRDKQMIFDQIVEESARRKNVNGVLTSEDFEFLLG